MAASKRSEYSADSLTWAKLAAAYRERESEGADLSKRLHELRSADPWKVSDLVLDLFREARHYVRLYRQSIAITRRSRGPE